MSDHRFAVPEDYEVCRQLHRQFGTTYYYSSRFFPSHIKRRTDAVYGFVRVPDEWVDNPQCSPAETVCLLEDWQKQFNEGLLGKRPEHPAMRAFCDTVREVAIPPQEPQLFLEAMKMDLTKVRYENYQELQDYMRGSASSVGIMMAHVLELPMKPNIVEAAMSLGEAMQLTNFLRDVGEDFARGRVYLPQDEMRAFGVTEQDIADGTTSEPFINLMKFEIARARRLYEDSHSGMRTISGSAGTAIILARVLYSLILDRIEENGYDVFRTRARTTKSEKLVVASKVILNPHAILNSMESTR